MVASGVAFLVSAYYVAGELLINLYSEVAPFHAGWVLSLGVLWWLAFQASFGIWPNVLGLSLVAGVLFLSYAQLESVCDRNYEKARDLGFERLGVAPEDFGTGKDPWADFWWQLRLGDPEVRLSLRAAMIGRKPGWCRATVLLARDAGDDIPRVINWTPAEPLSLCGTGSDRGFLPFPTLRFVNWRLRLERQLIGSAESLWRQTVEREGKR